jgi:hypothetical protein
VRNRKKDKKIKSKSKERRAFDMKTKKIQSNSKKGHVFDRRIKEHGAWSRA